MGYDGEKITTFIETETGAIDATLPDCRWEKWNWWGTASGVFN